jgi:hypothetical protein
VVFFSLKGIFTGANEGNGAFRRRFFATDAFPGGIDIFPESETNFFLKINGAQLAFIKDEREK